MSINIEEERVAFEAWLKSSFDYNEYDDKEYLFPVWLAAKEHAAEMAKPTSRIEMRKEREWLVIGNFFTTVFCTEKEAISHANANGYRVIEE